MTITQNPLWFVSTSTYLQPHLTIYLQKGRFHYREPLKNRYYSLSDKAIEAVYNNGKWFSKSSGSCYQHAQATGRRRHIGCCPSSHRKQGLCSVTNSGQWDPCSKRNLLGRHNLPGRIRLAGFQEVATRTDPWWWWSK